MQFIYFTSLNPEEYLNSGQDPAIPEPHECLHPKCREKIAPKKHGSYERNVISPGFSGRISIHRYYCPYCGHTFSYLPSFCLPYYQYSLKVIFLSLICSFFMWVSWLEAFIKVTELNLQRQHHRFYHRRFLCNLPRIQLGLRALLPRIELSPDSAHEKGARKVLALVLSGFPQIQTFSTRFFAQSNHSFMAPCTLV